MAGRRRTISEFHYWRIEPPADAFRSESALLDDLRFQLGLPKDYPRDRVDLAIAMASIADRDKCVLRHWDYVPGKMLVVVVRVNAVSMSSPATVTMLTSVIAMANAQLEAMQATERVWLEWIADIVRGDRTGVS